MKAPAMKTVFVGTCAILVFLGGAERIRQFQSVQDRTQFTPANRVVELLKSLSEKLEGELKEEEALYEKFVCWAQTVISTKTQSNADATSRLGSLKEYLADLLAGRVELTNERQELETQLKDVNAAIEEQTELCAQDAADFEQAKHEMEGAIFALQAAVDVLTAAASNLTKTASAPPAANGSLLELGVSSAGSLDKALEIAEKKLTARDARFLRRLLTGDVPDVDWQKVHKQTREADDFRMNSAKRSTEIAKTLQKMLTMFETELKDAKTRAGDAKTACDEGLKAKGQQKADLEKARAEMEKETGARGGSKAETEAEISELEKQVADDTTFIAQTKDSLTTKKQEWKTRKSLRLEELEAMAKAISIIHSDEARDVFTKSFKSQGFSFVQLESNHGNVALARAALERVVRVSDGERRFAHIAEHLADANVTMPSMTKVIEMIDKMVVVLNEEAANDLKDKEECEKVRAEDTRTAITLSRTMDEETDNIARLISEIEEAQTNVKAKNEEIASIKKAQDEATEIRTAENKDWQVSDADDKDAIKLMTNAKATLRDFYEKNDLKLELMQRQKQPGGAGEAPLPPPATWEGAYKGATSESTGIVAIMEMLIEDMNHDVQNALAEEEASKKAYDEAMKKMDDQISLLGEEISQLEDEISQKNGEVDNLQASRANNKGELDLAMERMHRAEPGCDFITINFQHRSKTRQLEIDGLLKAKTFLEGGTFVVNTDATRELKPGDALLQRIAGKQ